MNRHNQAPNKNLSEIGLIAGLVAVTGLSSRLRLKNQKLKKENQQLRHDASHDSLTGLLNKNAFTYRTNQRLAEARPGQIFAMLFIDLDSFKAINDKHPGGHDEGDRVLKRVADILLKDTRQQEYHNDLVAHGKREDSDSNTARLGGDEFALFVELTARNDRGVAMSQEDRLTALCERLNTDFGVLVDNRPDLSELGFGMSVGATLYSPGDTAETMLTRGDKLMFEAKAIHHAENGSYRS